MSALDLAPLATTLMSSIRRPARRMSRGRFSPSRRPRRGSLEIRPAVATAFLTQYERGRLLAEPERDALPTLVALVYMPRGAKCKLLAAEGEDPSARVTDRIETVSVIVQLRLELLKLTAV